MPVLSHKFKEGDFVTHEGKSAVVLWVNKDRSRTGAIKYIAPYQNCPARWRVKLSELTLVPPRKIYNLTFFSLPTPTTR